MVDERILREWMAKAHEDFAFAQINLEEGKPFFAQICFHFHQAAEKYLKAYIVTNELDFRKATTFRCSSTPVYPTTRLPGNCVRPASI